MSKPERLSANEKFGQDSLPSDFKHQKSILKFSVKVHEGTRSIFSKLEDEEVFSLAATMIERSKLRSYMLLILDPRSFRQKCSLKNIFADLSLPQYSSLRKLTGTF